MTVFPTTSTNVLEVKAGKYDIAQLAANIYQRLDEGPIRRMKLPGEWFGLKWLVSAGLPADFSRDG